MSSSDWAPHGIWQTYLTHFNVLEQGKRDFETSANEFLNMIASRAEHVAWNQPRLLEFKKIRLGSFGNKSYIEYQRTSSRIRPRSPARATKTASREHSLVVRIGFTQGSGRSEGEFYTYLRYAGATFTTRTREIIERFRAKQLEAGETHITPDPERPDSFYYRFVASSESAGLADRALDALASTVQAAGALLADLGGK